MVIKGSLDINAFQSPSLSHRSIFNPSFLTGIKKAHSLSLKHDECILCRIPRLYRCGGPSAILFRVAKVIVDTINRVLSARAWSHVYQKVSKVFPPWIYSNPATSVVFVSWVRRILASRYHVRPCGIFGAHARLFAMAMFFAPFTFQAPARFCERATEMRAWYISRVPAIAFACPVRLIAKLDSTTNYGESSENLTCQVNKSHDLIITSMDKGIKPCQ